MPIENWTVSEKEKNEALELQGMIKDAGLSWPQLDMLLELKRGVVAEWCRAHSVVPAGMMERIKEILEKVKVGKIKPPVVSSDDFFYQRP